MLLTVHKLRTTLIIHLTGHSISSPACSLLISPLFVREAPANLQMELVKIFRAERYGFMFTPLKLTASLKVAHEPHGVVTMFPSASQKKPDNEFYLSRIMSTYSKTQCCRNIIESCIKDFQSKPEEIDGSI